MPVDIHTSDISTLIPNIKLSEYNLILIKQNVFQG